MKKTTRFFAAMLLVAVLMTAVLSCGASAVSFDNKVKTYSESILMVNLDTGMEVFSKEADQKQYPAGLTKIMTYIVAAEQFDDFDKTKIKIKPNVLSLAKKDGMSTSGLEWHEGESLSVTDLLYAMMLPTGHDAALVLADYIGGGNQKKFVEMMNQKAKKLGCKNTHFTNPTGVHDKNHYSTARDLYTMTKYAMGLPMFSKIVGTADYNLPGDEYPITTTNYMIDGARGGEYYYMYATGVKNGTTPQAGRCLVATAVYEGYAYMVVCLHAPYDEAKEDMEQYCMIEAADLFRWAFLNLQFVTVATKDTPVCEQKVDHAWDTDSILLVPEHDLNVVLPDDYKEGDVTVVPDSSKSVSAPIAKGDVVTTASVFYKGDKFSSINLVAQDSVSVSPILYTTDAIRAVLTSVWFLAAVAVIVVLFIIYVSVSSSYQRKKRTDRRKH